jgi:hypothetical protein
MSRHEFAAFYPCIDDALLVSASLFNLISVGHACCLLGCVKLAVKILIIQPQMRCDLCIISSLFVYLFNMLLHWLVSNTYILADRRVVSSTGLVRWLPPLLLATKHL